MWGTVGCGPILGHLGTLEPTLHCRLLASHNNAYCTVTYKDKHRTTWWNVDPARMSPR